MTIRSLATALAAGLSALFLAGLASAQEATCPLDYMTFEPAVPHLDLATCPQAMAVEGAYCRVALSAEIATIFAFSEEDDCLVASKALFDDAYRLSFE